VVLAAGGPALWRHDGRGGLSAETLPGEALAAAALGDVDGDGDADLVLAGGALARLLVNDGTGRFSEDSAGIAPAPSDATALDVGDFTGDGALDLVVGQGDAADAPPRAYANDGAGHLRASSAYLPEVPGRARAVHLGDLDGDGDLDVVLGGVSGVRIYINRGNGRLDDRSFERLPAGLTGEIAAAAASDLDGDCLPDLALPRAGGAPALLTGTGTGALATSALSAPTSASAEVADLDGDGVRDLVLAGPTGVTWVGGP